MSPTTSDAILNSNVITFEWAIFCPDTISFNIDGNQTWLWWFELKEIFTKDKFANTREAFINKLTNSAEFMNDKFVKRTLDKFPAELKLKVAMSKLTRE